MYINPRMNAIYFSKRSTGYSFGVFGMEHDDLEDIIVASRLKAFFTIDSRK